MVFVSETKEKLVIIDEIGIFMPISELLGEMDSSHIECFLHEHLNYAQQRKWEYPPILLFKFLIVKTFRKLLYRRIINSLTIEDCEFLGMSEKEPGIFSIPSASTLHDFAFTRLGPNGLKKIMFSNGIQICWSISN